MSENKLKYLLSLNFSFQIYFALSWLYLGYLSETNQVFINNGACVENIFSIVSITYLFFSFIVMTIHRKVQYNRRFLLSIILITVTIWFFELFFIQ